MDAFHLMKMNYFVLPLALFAFCNCAKDGNSGVNGDTSNDSDTTDIGTDTTTSGGGDECVSGGDEWGIGVEGVVRGSAIVGVLVHVLGVGGRAVVGVVVEESLRANAFEGCVNVVEEVVEIY